VPPVKRKDHIGKGPIIIPVYGIHHIAYEFPFLLFRPHGGEETTIPHNNRTAPRTFMVPFTRIRAMHRASCEGNRHLSGEHSGRLNEKRPDVNAGPALIHQ
jgi:hypothetical protein